MHMIEKMHEAESYERKNKGGHAMNRFKCPACGGEQYTAKDTAKGCIFCGHQGELEKMLEMEPEKVRGK